jgi:hypothetical protein
MLTSMSAAERLAVHWRGETICRLLRDVGVNMPLGLAFDILREVANLLHAEFIRHGTTDLICEVGYLILQLARPAIADEGGERGAEICDLIDILFGHIENDVLILRLARPAIADEGGERGAEICDILFGHIKNDVGSVAVLSAQASIAETRVPCDHLHDEDDIPY